jgi:hypothetical protein
LGSSGLYFLTPGDHFGVILVSRGPFGTAGVDLAKSLILVDFPDATVIHFGVNFGTQELQSREKTEKSSVRNVAFKKFASRAHPKQAKE